MRGFDHQNEPNFISVYAYEPDACKGFCSQHGTMPGVSFHRWKLLFL